MTNKTYRTLALGLAITLTSSIAVCSAAEPAAAFPAPQNGIQQEPLADGSTPPGPPPDGNMPSGNPADMQQGKDISTFTAAFLLDGTAKKSTNEIIMAENADENAVLLKNKAALTMTNATLKKIGDTTNGDNSNFKGQNAVFLAFDSTAVLSNTTLASSGEGSNAVFATGKTSKVTADHLKIHTTKNSSRGLDATYNGTIIATDIDVTTEGNHCAALATDRGEGTIAVTRGTFTTAGEGSPCIYSTGSISVNDSHGIASDSEIAVVEGKNSITLNNADLTGSKKHGIMLYQSFSGDATTGIAKFNAANSKLTSLADGPMFYITNTQAEATLENTQLHYKGNTLINVTSDHWGKSGTNGGDFTFTGINQILRGDVIANNISTVVLNLKNKTTLTGAINKDKAAKEVTLYLDKTSVWNVTADSYLTILTDDATSLKNIKSNGHTIYYESGNIANAWLKNKEHKLSNGGKLIPLPVKTT